MLIVKYFKYKIMKLSCVNVVIRSAEDVKLVSTIRESVMQGNFVSESILKSLDK